MAKVNPTDIPTVVMTEDNRTDPKYGNIFRIGDDRHPEVANNATWWLGYIIDHYKAVCISNCYVIYRKITTGTTL